LPVLLPGLRRAQQPALLRLVQLVVEPPHRQRAAVQLHVLATSSSVDPSTAAISKDPPHWFPEYMAAAAGRVVCRGEAMPCRQDPDPLTSMIFSTTSQLASSLWCVTYLEISAGSRSQRDVAGPVGCGAVLRTKLLFTPNTLTKANLDDHPLSLNVCG
jgi:hypothetical protein